MERIKKRKAFFEAYFHEMNVERYVCQSCGFTTVVSEISSSVCLVCNSVNTRGNEKNNEISNQKEKVALEQTTEVPKETEVTTLVDYKNMLASMDAYDEFVANHYPKEIWKKNE
ncbi:hypothetical protein [Wenyingzhuangia sp. 2_MG-2023]|uniref:hypothetical protein n=1 Tax=Wenyingzhuangia sp. 2_MG-2023 TaxID=3062639 RepID=UPI0026E1831A|nr:hypothetical protein [Wenyingzhuangia sp. 2_MG-2023]MDO6739239.1 hypothetical protein [Wenyingzhuangia sp. 2_MG-2023]MDO6803861.1 hypothetical protein [Wenyingzhuangia sp. 1_MG-2023]